LKRHKHKLIKAAYAYSEELGKEVEALVKGKGQSRQSGPDRLKRLRKLLKREFGKDAGLVYETVLSVLNSSD
jgi:hypothetical protein